MAIQKKLYTVEEFEQFADAPENRDRLLELIDGEIVEKAMPTQEHGLIISILIAYLFPFLNASRLGRIGTEVRHRVPGDEHNARQPDISINLDITTPVVTRGSVQRMPDVAIEVQSPNDSVRHMRERAEYYLANGTRLVWLVYPRQRLVEVYKQDADIQFLIEEDALDGGDVLPGFTLPVRTLFETMR